MWADNVLVLFDWLADQREDRLTASGLLYVPHSARRPPQDSAAEATVLDCRERWFEASHLERRGTDGVMVKRLGVWRESDIRRGTRVLVDRADQGDVYELDDGREARIIRQHNVIGVLEEESAEHATG